MRLTRTDKQLTEADAIALAQALTGIVSWKAELVDGVRMHPNDFYRIDMIGDIDYDWTFTMDVKTLGVTGMTNKSKPIQFTNKALVLGYYEIVE